jgi:hypothetical protein
MSHRPSILPRAVPSCLAAVLLAGCADMFTVPIPETGPSLVGEISSEPARPGENCEPMRVEVFVLQPATDPRYRGAGEDPVGELSGRAYYAHEAAAGGLGHVLPTMQPWWLEGDLYPNGIAVVTLYRSTLIPAGPADAQGAKPFSVFMGSFTGERLEVTELAPFCGRTLLAEVPAPAV